MTPEAGPGQNEPRPKKPLVSRVRAIANVTMFVSGAVFAIGWIVMIAAAGTWEEQRMATLTTFLAYVGLIAVLSFITSVASIIIENRTVPAEEEGPW